MAGFEPQRVVRSRRVEEGDAGGGWEEYVEYIFPDTTAEQPNRKLLAFANKWAMLHEHSDDDDDDEEEEENGDYDSADENVVPRNDDSNTNAVVTETASMNEPN